MGLAPCLTRTPDFFCSLGRAPSSPHLRLSPSTASPIPSTCVASPSALFVLDFPQCLSSSCSPLLQENRFVPPLDPLLRSLLLLENQPLRRRPGDAQLLRSDPSVVIRPADKDGRWVVMDSSDYNAECLRLLSDSSFYYCDLTSSLPNSASCFAPVFDDLFTATSWIHSHLLCFGRHCMRNCISVQIFVFRIILFHYFHLFGFQCKCHRFSFRMWIHLGSFVSELCALYAHFREMISQVELEVIREDLWNKFRI